LFYDRVKKYAEALNQTSVKESVRAAFSETLKQEVQEETHSNFVLDVSDYLTSFDSNLSSLTIGQIALTEFSFPELAA